MGQRRTCSCGRWSGEAECAPTFAVSSTFCGHMDVGHPAARNRIAYHRLVDDLHYTPEVLPTIFQTFGALDESTLSLHRDG